MHRDGGHRAGEQVGGEAGRTCGIAGSEAGLARDLFRAVRAVERRAHGQGIAVVTGEDGDRAVAIAAEARQQRAFGKHRGAAFRVINGSEKGEGARIVSAAFDHDRGLGRGGEPVLRVERMAGSGLAKAFQPGGGEESRIGFPGSQLGEAGGDIAPEGHDLAVRSGIEQLRGAARGAGADDGALRQCTDALGADQHVAHVLTRENRTDCKRFRANRLDILGGMDGEIDFTARQPGVQFLRPQRLSTDFRQCAVLNAIAAGGDGNDLYMRGIDSVCGGQPVARFLGLSHRQRRTSGAEAEVLFLRVCLRRHRRVVLPGNVVQWKGRSGKVGMRTVLGIESSCDETAAALVTSDRTILAQRIASQDEAHRPYGGVVPEIAARAHSEKIAPLIEATLADAGMTLDQVDAIAATAGPGLIGGVMVGLVTAKALAMATGKPLIAVNHLEGHALSPRLADGDLQYPYLLLLVSGGHCQILLVEGVGKFRRLATTIDDALGEAFDKSAKLLGLGYPGGPAMERLALEGNPKAVPLPRPLKGSDEPHFSFAGLKSAVMRAKESGEYADADIAASFQQAAIDCLIDRARRALDTVGKVNALVVAGGVAANKAVRGALEALAADYDLEFVAPPLGLCTDNAAMIAWAGVERFAMGQSDPLDVAARPRWPLDPDAETVRGAGVKA